MPTTSPAQHRLMEAAAHTPGGYGGVPQKVGKEFVSKDMAPSKWGLLKRLFVEWINEEEKEPEHAAQDEAPKGRASSVAFVVPDGRVLFVKRSPDEKNYPATWAWPGGKADGDEPPEACAKREAQEELGATCPPMDDLRQLETKRTPYGWDHTTFVAPVGEPFTPTLNAEHSEHCWSLPDQAPEPLHPGVRATLEGLGGADAGQDTNALPYTSRVLRAAGVSTAGNTRRLETAARSRAVSPTGADNLTTAPSGGVPIAAQRKVDDAADPTGRLSATTREQVGSSRHREDMPEGAFLGPHKTYPVKEKRGDEWKYTRNLLLAAARRARLQGRTDIAKRADAIRAREFGGDVASDRAMAMDRASSRSYDADGRLHVDQANISKAVVNPYYGEEINKVMENQPGWQPLQPDRKYMLLRPAEELEKATQTFNGLPILWVHKPTSAEDHPHEITIGATGNEAVFEAPYLKNSLSIWPAYASAAIEDGDQKQLSAGYKYRAVMEPGEYEGARFDGRMVDLVGNHIALVVEGRAGADVGVGDSLVEMQWAAIESALRTAA